MTISANQILLTMVIAMLTTVVVILIAGFALFFVIVAKVKAVALQRSRGAVGGVATRTALAQMEKLAWLMDSSIPIAGYRIGLDGIIDLVPGIGDLAGVLISAWIIYRAAACGAPQRLLMRMAGNVIVDGLLGSLPLLGVVADSAFKSNERNVAIFRQFVNQSERTRLPDQLQVGKS